MSLRTAFTIVLSAAAAGVIASACDPAQEFCTPKLESTGAPQDNPECSDCIADQCADAGKNCAGPCEDYGSCTCDCAEDDLSCFEACSAERSESCVSCQEESSNLLFECASQRCGVCGFGGGEAGGDDDADSSPPSDSGDDSWSDSGGADDASSFTDGGESSSGSACEQLHTQCCPQLEGFDLELCQDASDEGSCQLWLDIFTEEGSC